MKVYKKIIHPLHTQFHTFWMESALKTISFVHPFFFLHRCIPTQYNSLYANITTVLCVYTSCVFGYILFFFNIGEICMHGTIIHVCWQLLDMHRHSRRIMAPCICIYYKFWRWKEDRYITKKILKLRQNNKTYWLRSQCFAPRKKYKENWEQPMRSCSWSVDSISIFLHFQTPLKQSSLVMEYKFKFPNHIEWSLECNAHRKIWSFLTQATSVHPWI